MIIDSFTPLLSDLEYARLIPELSARSCGGRRRGQTATQPGSLTASRPQIHDMIDALSIGEE